MEPTKTKLEKILDERGLTSYALNTLMVAKGYPPANNKTLRMICEGKKALQCTLTKKAYPLLLERICNCLDIKAKDIIEY